MTVKPYVFDLRNRIAIVSGGGTGIGRAIAVGLAQAGASVAVCGRRLEKCEEARDEIKAKTGISALAHSCDISKRDEVDKLVRRVLDHFGRIDILVNNAGVTSTYPFLELPEEEWDRVINTNLKGYFLCSQAVGGVMANAEGGVIINIGSQLGDVAQPGKAHYVTSKGGVKMLTKALAVDLAPYKIRVNAVAPGPVETELAAPLLSDPAIRATFLQRLPIGRLGQPEDVAGAVVFLASDGASFITGITVYVDGGYIAI
jgi:NAD(P)-dependent dehydrogenase (short-subunit alcohol dehydrogenase family)